MKKIMEFFFSMINIHKKKKAETIQLELFSQYLLINELTNFQRIKYIKINNRFSIYFLLIL